MTANDLMGYLLMVGVLMIALSLIVPDKVTLKKSDGIRVRIEPTLFLSQIGLLFTVVGFIGYILTR